jgi:glycerol-3-phosphate dehydrogenase
VYDVAIVGAGVSGSFIAKELSKYELSVVVFEAKSAAGLGQTKGCSGIIHPFQLPFKLLRSKLCLEGNRMMDEESEELGFEFRRVGLLLLATNWITFFLLPFIKFYLSRNVEVKLLSKDKILEMEPNVREDIKGGLFVPSAGVVNPVEMTVAAQRFAMANGVEFIFDCKVTGIERKLKHFVIKTTKGDFEARYVINCAGLYADEIARMVGYEMEILPGKGSHIVFREKDFAKHIVVAIPLKPDKRTKGGGALVSFDGKSIWGPNLVDVSDKEDTSVKRQEIEGIKRKFGKLFKRMPKDIVAYYAGVRSMAGRDFVINQPVRNFINVAGIQSPGLTAAPAIAKMVLRMLAGSGMDLRKKKTISKPTPMKRFSKMNEDEIEKAIQENPEYGEIVCLCNLVSKAEIKQAIDDAPCLDGVRHLTWAGMDCNKCIADIIILMQRHTKRVVKDREGSDVAWQQ